MVTAGMAGPALAAFLAWYWSLPSWSGWLAAWVSADRPIRKEARMRDLRRYTLSHIMKKVRSVHSVIEPFKDIEDARALAQPTLTFLTFLPTASTTPAAS